MGWQTALDALYANASLGVAATLDIGDTASPYDLTVIDKTEGVSIDQGGVDLQSVTPAATLRVSELSDLGLERGDLVDGTMVFNGGSWVVTATRPRPMPDNDGELLLLLRQSEAT